MNWSINGRIVKSLMKDGKEIVKVERTEDGKILYEKENNYVVATVTGDSISFGSSNLQWLYSTGDVVIDWGDGTSDTVNNPRSILSHTYTDSESEHTIKFNGEVTGIGNQCFERRSNLISIWIPYTVTSIGYKCFIGCTGLTRVTLPDGVTSLEAQCFYNCTSLTSVIIPNSVTNLKDYCFGNCTALIDYQLYWIGDNIITYNRNRMPNNTNSIFTIPIGETTNYVVKGYPSSKLVERGTQ